MSVRSHQKFPRNQLMMVVGSALVGVVLFTVPLQTREDFDENSVMPTDCANGNMKCGFVPLSASERSAVPDDPSNMIRHRGLPSRMDLSSEMPPIGNQGRQGSCVGWATGYGMKSYMENKERRWGFGRHAQRGGPGSHVFSPAFIYNQINGGRDRGSNPVNALNLLQRRGATPWKNMPYTDRDYRSSPSQEAVRQAGAYKIKSFQGLRHTNPSAIKNQLAKGRVVFAGVKVYTNFYKLGNGVYERGQGQFRGGHALLLVGYDDNKKGQTDRGAFRIFNSWGTGWGDKGFGWISYKGMARVGLGAFAVYDLVGGTEPGGKETPVTPPAETTTKKGEVTPPSRISASRGTYSNQIVVSWSGVEGAVAYAVHRAEPGGSSFATVGYSRTTTFNDSKVQPDVSYKYRVVSVGEKGFSDADQSPIAEGYARSRAVGKPARVTGVAAVQNTRGQVELRWNRTAGAEKYQVIRYDAGRRKWKTLTNTRNNSYTDKRPVKDNRNYYRVAARNRKGRGQWSENIQVAIGGRETPPGQVTGLFASKGLHKDRIDLTWKKVPGAAFYGLFRYDPRTRKITGVHKVFKTEYQDVSGEARSGKEYGYLVAAFNRAGRGKFSNYERGYSSPGQHRGAILSAPRNLKGVIDEKKRSIALSWDKVKKANAYYVFRKKAGDKDYRYIADAGTKTSYTAKIPGDAGTLYLFVVRTKSMFGGESADSNAVSAFVNAERFVVKHRFGFENDGFDRFKGRWSATEWDGESAPKKIVLEMDRDGTEFKGTMQVAGGKTRRFKGSFVAKSNTVESEGFRMELAPSAQGVSSVEVSDRGDEELELSFTRE